MGGGRGRQRLAPSPRAAVAVEVVDTDAVVLRVAQCLDVLLGWDSVRERAVRVVVVHRERAQIGGAVLAHARHVLGVAVVVWRKGEGAVASVVGGKAKRGVIVGFFEQDAVAVGELVAVLLRLVKRGHCRKNVRPVQPVLCGGERMAPRQLVVVGKVIWGKPAQINRRAVDFVGIVVKGVRLRPTMRYWRRGRRWRRRHRRNSTKAMGCSSVRIIVRRDLGWVNVRRSHTL